MCVLGNAVARDLQGWRVGVLNDGTASDACFLSGCHFGAGQHTTHDAAVTHSAAKTRFCLKFPSSN